MCFNAFTVAIILLTSFQQVSADNSLSSGQDSSLQQVLNPRGEVQNFYQTLSENWHETSLKIQSQAGKEFDRFNFSSVIGLKNGKITILGGDIHQLPTTLGDFDISSNIYYQIVVQPSFYKGKQLRKDIYVVGLTASQGLSLGTELRITFFREFDSKSDALFTEPPYWLSRFPRSQKKLLENFNDREGVRVEIIGNAGFNKGLSDKLTTSALGVSVGYGFEGLFLMDIFKNSAHDARVRFLSSRNKGTTKVRAEATVGKKLLAFAPRWLKDLTQVGFTIDGQKSYNPLNDFPIETSFFDYYFKFAPTEDSSNSSAQAFNEIIENLLHGKFLSTFDPRASDEDVAQKLKEGSSLATTLAREDELKPLPDRRVFQIFHGSMGANIFSFNWGPKISHLFRNTNGFGQSKIFVSSLNASKTYDHYILLNAFSKEKNSAFFGRSESEFISDIDALFDSNEQKSVLGLHDFIMRVQYKDKEMGADEFKKIYRIIDESIPRSVSERDRVLKLIPAKNQKNALLSFKYVLSAEAFAELNKIPASDLYYKLYYFIENHPERSYMDLPSNNPEGGYQQAYGDFIQDLTTELKSIDQFAALERLMRKKVFARYLLNQFIPTLIPEKSFSEHMSFQITSSAKDLPSQTEVIGTKRTSPVYDSVQFLRSILNDRNYDLKIETIQNENGDMELVMSRMKFKPTSTPAP